MLGCRHRGWLAMRSTAPTPGRGPSCRPARSAMCWRSPATTGSASVASPAGARSCSRGPRPGVAVFVGRSGRQGPPPVRLGVCAPGPRWSPPADQAGRPWLMVRRNRATGELAFYRCFTPRPTPLAVLVKVAGRRWPPEERFQTSKGLCGLDQHQVRRWHSWYRWVTLAMLAHAFLVVAALAERGRSPASPELIEPSCNEVSHLFAALVAPPADDQDQRLAR